MSTLDDAFAEELKTTFDDEHKPTPEETPEKTPETPESPADPKNTEEAPKEEAPADGSEKPQGDKKPEGEEPESPETPKPEGEETPPEAGKPEGEPETPATPLTKDDVKAVISDMRAEDQNSSKEIKEYTDDVLKAYYPDGLSNVLTDESGNELKSPQDVVDATGGKMSIEEASKWLMNEQYKLDKDVAEIKSKAQKIAETNLNFEKDSKLVLQKYEPLFKAYPQLQAKTWDAFQKQVQTDKDGKFILSAPDIREFYDLVLDPYRMAFEQGQQQPATAPTEPEKPAEPPKPTTQDRLDITGDGGSTEALDPNDFAANVKHELKNG